MDFKNWKVKIAEHNKCLGYKRYKIGEVDEKEYKFPQKMEKVLEKSIIAGAGQSEMMRIIQNEDLNCGILTEQMLFSGRADLKKA